MNTMATSNGMNDSLIVSNYRDHSVDIIHSSPESLSAPYTNADRQDTVEVNFEEPYEPPEFREDMDVLIQSRRRSTSPPQPVLLGSTSMGSTSSRSELNPRLCNQQLELPVERIVQNGCSVRVRLGESPDHSVSLSPSGGTPNGIEMQPLGFTTV